MTNAVNLYYLYIYIHIYIDNRYREILARKGDTVNKRNMRFVVSGTISR